MKYIERYKMLSDLLVWTKEEMEDVTVEFRPSQLANPYFYEIDDKKVSDITFWFVKDYPHKFDWLETADILEKIIGKIEGIYPVEYIASYEDSEVPNTFEVALRMEALDYDD